MSVYTPLTAIGGQSDVPTWAADPPGTRAGLEALGDRLRDPERPDIKPRNVLDVSPPHDLGEQCANAIQRGQQCQIQPQNRHVLHPHFNRLFRGLMSLRRRSHGPADVIPHVWRCHCRPERTLSKSVHCLRPVEWRFTPVSATKSRLCTLCYGTQTPVHPQYCVEGAEKKRACSPPHPCAAL